MLLTVHGNASHDVLTQVLGDLEDELLAAVLCLQSVQNWRKSVRGKLDCTQMLSFFLNLDSFVHCHTINDSTNDGVDLSLLGSIC